MTDAIYRQRLIAFVWAMTVCGLLLAAGAIGWNFGVRSERIRAERYSVAWMAGENCAAADIQSRGGTLNTLTTRDGWTATVTIDGETFEASDANRERAVLAAVAKWKGL